MFKSITRWLVAATAILAMSVPSAAYAFIPVTGSGSPASDTAPAPIVVTTLRASSPGFQWGDAGIGALAVVALAGVGSGAALMLRRRLHHPLAS